MKSVRNTFESLKTVREPIAAMALVTVATALAMIACRFLGLSPLVAICATQPVSLLAIVWAPAAYSRRLLLDGASHISGVASGAKTTGHRAVLHYWQPVPELWPKKGHEAWVGAVVIRTEDTISTHRVYGFGECEREMIERARAVQA